MPVEERYLGGISGSRIGKGVVGYGLYLTDKRLFGVRNFRALGSMLMSMPFAHLGPAIELSRPSDESAKAIAELERKHDFVVSKVEVSELRLAKPGFITKGYLLVLLKSGKKIQKIRFTEGGVRGNREVGDNLLS